MTAVDVAAKALTTAAGDTFTYDALVVATGARPSTFADYKTPGADLKGVLYLRNVGDADALLAELAAVKAAGGRVVCVGGGYIGMETAAAISLHGVDVTMIFPEPRLLQRLFTPQMAAFYELYFAAKGVKMVKGGLAAALEGGPDGRVARVVLKSGEKLDADLVVVGVGARPNVELFRGQLDLLEGPPGGVKTDAHLRTSAPGVWAVGDVAAYPLALAGGALQRQEHVANCRASAAHAVTAALTGSDAEYYYVPYFYSRVYDLSWVFYGLSSGEAVHYGDYAEGSRQFGAYFVDGGKVIGAFLEGGSPEDAAALKRLAEARPDAPADLAEQGLKFATR